MGAPTTYHLTPIVIKGYKFFNSETKENILIKGIDYYPRPNFGDLDVNNFDFFTEEFRHVWERDILQFQELGVNAIRLYSVNPAKDHSAFMCALEAAGIYALVELASGDRPNSAILSDEAPDCYPKHLKTRGQVIMREFSRYSNTLAFSAGNEVNHFVPLGKGPQWNAPCLKKFVRDMRAFARKCKGMRHVPVGLIMADSDRDENTLYYNCQSTGDDLEHAEWYGLNTYVYCNGNRTSFEEAVGFKTLSDSFDSYNYSIPVLLTEFGCLSKSFPTIDGYEGQRSFNQAKWLGLPQVQNNFAGGFAFEYSIESSIARTPFPFKEFGEQNYGVGYFSPQYCDDVKVMCEYKRTPSFYNLKRAYAEAKAENLSMDEFRPDAGRMGRTPCPPSFPSIDSFEWQTDRVWDAWCPKNYELAYTCPASGRGTTMGVNPSISSVAGIFTILSLIVVAYLARKFQWAIPKSSHDNVALLNGLDMPEHGSSLGDDSEDTNLVKQSTRDGYSSLECSAE
mmetsp:Transcript_13977/g.26301  ORF Transcript_13977/g.26301 Transcript_13977/m.26301 type:complete len:508 (+) Transcript_13977:471-1994(+)